MEKSKLWKLATLQSMTEAQDNNVLKKNLSSSSKEHSRTLKHFIEMINHTCELAHSNEKRHQESIN